MARSRSASLRIKTSPRVVLSLMGAVLVGYALYVLITGRWSSEPTTAHEAPPAPQEAAR